MRKDQQRNIKAFAIKRDDDEAAFKAFLIVSLISLALLTLTAGIFGR